MTDWRLLAIALAFVAYMAKLEKVNRRAMKFAGVLVLALAGYKTLPLLAPMFAPGSAQYSGVAEVAEFGPGPTGPVVVGSRNRTGSPPPSGAIGVPNTPTVTATVVDTSTWWVDFSAFVGSGGDTQDSIHIQVDRNGGNFSSPLTDVKSGVQTRDTLSDNTDWKADSTYVVRGRQKGLAGGWSVYDSVTVVNTQPALPSLTFAVDWSTATGTSDSALRDGTTINIESGTAPNLDVVTSASLGAPGDWPTNMLRLFYEGDNWNNVGFNSEGGNYGWALPAVGEFIYFRVLMWTTLGGSSNVAFEHGMQSNTGSLFQYFQIFDDSGGVFSLGFGSGSVGGVYAIGLDGAGGITKAAPIRVEWAFERTGTSTYVLHGIRIYNETISEVTPQWDHGDFLDNYGAGSNSLESVDPTFTASNTNHPRGYMFGSSGSSSSQNGGYVHWSGFGVRVTSSSSGWIGAFVAGEG